MTFKLFECKIGVNMLIDEGGIPTGSLSDYVSGRLAETKRQAAEESDRARGEWLQRSTPLREYLLKLAAPLDEFMAHFWG